MHAKHATTIIITCYCQILFNQPSIPELLQAVLSTKNNHWEYLNQAFTGQMPYLSSKSVKKKERNLHPHK